MKKVLIFILVVFSTIAINAQEENEYTLEGNSIETHTQLGSDFVYSKTSKSDITLYLNFNNPPSFMMIINDNYILGLLNNVMFYTKKGKVIEENEIQKMLDKGKVDHYIMTSLVTSNNSSYSFYIPYDLTYVEFVETQNNENYKFLFEVKNKYNGKPELPSINNNLNK